jgi:hypothetical protein
MNDLDVTRDTDDQEPFVTPVIDVDDAADPWSAWDDVGGEG